MQNEDEDLSFPEDQIDGPDPKPVFKKNEIQHSTSLVSPRAEPRGIGPASPYQREPIGCIVEILKRAQDQNGKWILYPPFDRTTPKDAKWTFAIMTTRTTSTRLIGNRESPCRIPHPDFVSYNTAPVERAQTLGIKLIHFTPEQAWNFHLGAYKAPPGHNGPATGWWCKGDGCTALRTENGKTTKIKCPNRMCEFSQEGSGPKQTGTWCKTHTRLIGQLNWGEKTPLPRIMFEWDSQSYHAYENVEAVFRTIKETAEQFGLVNFPVMGLPIRLSVDKTIKPGKTYPEVQASIDGDMMDYIGKMRAALAGGEINPGNQIAAPLPMNILPPPGMTQDDVDHQRLERLDPNYRPSNERK